MGGEGQALADRETDGPEDARTRRPQPVLDRGPRLALYVFIALEVIAFPMYLWFARDQWFHGDEWAFLADRQLGTFDDLMRPHVVHWCALPIALYRVLWNVVGINEYWPYQIFSVSGHLAVAALVRVVMRRSGVGPWIATACAGAFVLFGSGDQNIGWALQIAFTAPLALGLVQLILADHEGPIERRDWWGLAAGLAGLLCSSVAVTMIVVVGLAMVLRGRWRAALFQTVPLGIVFSIWWLAYGRNARITPDQLYVGDTLRFVWEATSGTFRSLGMLPGVGIALAVVIGAGLAIGLRGHLASRWQQAAAPVALLLGAGLFLLNAGWGRAYILGAEYGNTSRYLHITAALLLPSFALASEYLYRRWPVLGAGAVVLLLVGVPGNVSRAARYDERHALVLGVPRQIVAASRAPLAGLIPPDTRPFPNAARDLPIGWLVQAADDGKVPQLESELTEIEKRVLVQRLGLDVEDGVPPPQNCSEIREPTARTMRSGTTIAATQGVTRVSTAEGETIVTLAPGQDVSATVGPIEVWLSPAKAGASATVCS